jgi:hypothetical protein
MTDFAAAVAATATAAAFVGDAEKEDDNDEDEEEGRLPLPSTVSASTRSNRAMHSRDSLGDCWKAMCTTNTTWIVRPPKQYQRTPNKHAGVGEGKTTDETSSAGQLRNSTRTHGRTYTRTPHARTHIRPA